MQHATIASRYYGREMPTPLTVLDEEEQLFQSSVRAFAADQITPYVSEMDEAGSLRQELLGQRVARDRDVAVLVDRDAVVAGG